MSSHKATIDTPAAAGLSVPTPWTIYDNADELHIKIKGIRPDTGGAHVADVLGDANAYFILRAINNHDALVNALEGAILQIEYLHEKFKTTGSGNGVLSIARAALTGAK